MKKVLLAVLVLSCIGVSAQDCINWNYYRVITIDNSTGDELIDYQINIPLNTSQLVSEGKLQATGADIQVFADDCTPLSFWGDSLGISTMTNVWVKVPLIPAGATSTIQIYYGDETAESVADGDNTFIFFDDFESGEIDPAKWEAVGEYADFSITDGILSYASMSMNPGPRFKFARTVPSFSEEVIFDYVGAISNSNGFGFSSADVALDRVLFRISGAFGFDTLNQMAIMQDTISNGFATGLAYPFLRFDRFEYNTASVTAKVNDADHLEINRFANVGLGDENTDVYENENLSMTGFHFILSSFSATNEITLDNIRVRQSITSPPMINVGEEQEIIVEGIATLIDPAKVDVYPNPAKGSCFVKVDLQDQIVLEVFDALGQKTTIQDLRLNNGEVKELNLRKVTEGIYLLRFKRASDGALLHTRKLNIQ